MDLLAWSQIIRKDGFYRIGYYNSYYSDVFAGCEIVSKLLKRLEAAIGIEPMNKGFADLCLTTWLRRPGKDEG